MMIQIPNILSREQVKKFREILARAEWIDGANTAGHQSIEVKRNLQLAEGSDVARYLGAEIEDALAVNPLFISAALPAKVYPPLFNKYEGGGTFGNHVDNAIRKLRGTDFKVRTDLSATIFLSDPEEYEGGELIVEDTYGNKGVKLPAGDMILYPSKSVHRVTPVTRGARIASFFWLQSTIRLDSAREILFQMDNAIQSAAARLGSNDDAVLELTWAYHNLVRLWGDT